jgi:exodeoxyribonuclease VII small subunit
MARRKSDADPASTPQPSFEEALAGLESIIEEMEHENLPLEDLVAHYEKGAAYLSRCESILQSARKRIELITLRNQNEIELDADANPDETTQLPSQSLTPDDPDDDDDDIRLF